MKISEAIAEAKKLTGAIIEDNTMIRWLSELDGKIAFDVYGADAWAPYNAADINDDLLVSYPWDGQIYVPYLESMTFYETSEYDRYENSQKMYETALWEFRRYLNRTHWPIKKCKHICYRKEAPQECPLS